MQHAISPRYGCGALLNLAADDTMRGRLGPAGVSRAVVAALARHRGDYEVQLFGVWAVLNLARANAENRWYLRLAGAPQAVLAAQAAFGAKAPELHTKAVQASRELADDAASSR